MDLQDIRVLWWRRARADQRLEADERSEQLIQNDCRGALSGILASTFRGKWISSIDATDQAANKLYQLSVASRCGFRTPKTLVAQSRQSVAEFRERLNTRMIVKPIVGATGPLIFTQFLDDPFSLSEESYSACPAMFQEYIGGTKHLRINCFGSQSYAALIETSELDWRPNLNVPMSAWTVPEELCNRIRLVLEQLNLEMGIVDLKLTPQGEAVWLEVNPQGQFLFLEGLIKMPLSERFATFLVETALAAT